MKDIHYFKHDADSRHDQKIIKIRKKFGAKGYGIYFMLIEMLRSAQNYQLDLDIDSISYDIKEDPETIKDIIENYGLFINKQGIFYSVSLKNRMKTLDNIREGWKRGGKKRWEEQKKLEKKKDEYFNL